MTGSHWNLIHHEGTTLRQVGFWPDGSLYNPNNYPEQLVRAAVAGAEARRHERRSCAAKRAAVTRANRRTRDVQRAARAIAQRQRTGPRHTCFVCGRGLGDPQSIERGIGSECWQDVLRAVEEECRGHPDN
jgi:hypothetical protein